MGERMWLSARVRAWERACAVCSPVATLILTRDAIQYDFSSQLVVQIHVPRKMEDNAPLQPVRVRIKF